MRGLGLAFLIRRARSSWLLLACVAVTVLLTTGLAAVLWAFSLAVTPAGAQSILAAPQGRVVGLSGVVGTGDAAADSQLIRATFARAWPGVGFQMESALWGDPIELPAPPTSSTITRVQPGSLAGLSAQATLTAGEWPPAPHRGRPLPVALPAAAASRLHLSVGSVLTGMPQGGGAPTSLLVTGIFQPRNPASTYWTLDLLPSSGISVQPYSINGNTGGSVVSYGPAVVNPAAFGGTLATSQASWLVLPQAPAMARGNIAALTASTSQAFSQLAVIRPDGLQVTSGLPQILDGIASTIVLSRSLFTIAALMLLLVAGAALVLAARLLASLREEESALLRARGATRWQVARPVLAEAVVLGAAAGLAGVLAGTRLTGVLAGLGDLRLDGHPGINPLAWLSALAVLVLCAAVMVWPALYGLTPNAARRRRGRQARLATIAWAGGDLALVALAAVAVWQLRGYSAVAHPATGSLGIDPVVAVAPALALAGVALIPLRGLPLLASLAGIGNGGQMIALDATTAGQAILLRPDLSPLPLNALWQRITPKQPSGLALSGLALPGLALPGLALPGQPDRLEILADLGGGLGTSTAELRTALGSVTVTAWIQDASGATYQMPAAASLPADGRPHSLGFMLSGPGQASYPLRLLGLTLTFILPPYDPANPLSTPTANLTIRSLAVAATASGPFGRPFSPDAALAAWPGLGSSPRVPTGPPNAYGQLTQANGTTPVFLGWHAAAGGGEQLTFNTGHDPSSQVLSEVNFSSDLPAQVTVVVPPPQIIPAIATSGYLAANRLGIGSATSVSLGGVSVPVLIVAEVANFPTVFGPNRALIADLAEINDLLVANHANPLPVTRWWLRTADGHLPRLPAGLGLSVTSRSSQQAALFGNMLLTSPRQAMLAVGVAAVLLGAGGFSVSAAASLRSRRTQSAVFAALGVGKTAQAGQLCLEQCALSLPAAAAGLLAGIGLAELMVPAITLTADAAAPFPSALVTLPLGRAVALALVTAAMPVAAAALSVLRRPDPAVQLRAEAG